MRLTFYTKESIVLLLNKTNLSNTIFSYHSKLVITFFLLVFSANISFGNIQINNWQSSNYFSTKIHDYSKVLLAEVIETLENSQQEAEHLREWTALYQQFSTSSTTINSRVIAGTDDAEEDIALDGINEGLVDIGSSDLELGVESEAQLVGLRFTNIAIPRGAKIVSAYVEFEGDEIGSGTSNLTIYGEASDDANTFSTTTKDISSRPKTTALVTWNNLPTWSVNSKYKTTNIAPIIQELVDRHGWISGNDLAIMMEGTGNRTAESYNGEATAAPLLVVTYDDTPTTANHIATYRQNDNTAEFFSYDPNPTCTSTDWEADWTKFSCPDGFQIDEYDDGSLIINGTLVNIFDNCDRWDVYMRLENKRNWADWTALGRMYYESFDGGACNANRFDWNFYEIDSNVSRWTGTEGYCNETKEVSVNHSPTDYSKGVQVGFGANNCSTCSCQTYDVRGWMNLTGDLNLACADFGLNLNGYEIGNSCSIINGGFEEGLEHWFTSHPDVNLTNDAYVGNNAITISGDNQAISKSWLPATPGEMHIVSGWGKLTGSPSNTGINIDFYDKNRVLLSSSTTELSSNSWEYVNVGSIAPPNAYFFNIGLYKDTGGTATFDEICLEISPDFQASNCLGLINADFENTIGVEWYPRGTVTQSTDAVLGTYAAQIGGGIDGGISQNITVTPNKKYKLSAYIKESSTNGWTGLGITWLDASGTEIENISTNYFSSSYELNTLIVESPTGAASVGIWVSKFGSGDLFVDELCWAGIEERNNCSITNMYPGFALDPADDNCSWLDYTLDNDLNFTNNGDGTATITGKIVDGIDADWDGVSCTTSPCGSDDAWYLTLNLSNKQNWTELQAAGGTANVHSNCNANNLDYWDVSGTLTGLGCNSGRTLTINSAASNYRLQIGYGGNSNDSNCEFGLSTWFDIEENGSPMQADIYAFIDASCYGVPSEICDNNIDDDGDGLVDNDDPSCSIVNDECIGTNQGFESDFTDWETLATPTITTDAYNGTKAALLDENSESIIRVFDVNPDSSYLLSFYHKGNGGSWRGLNFQFLDADDNEIFAIDYQLGDVATYEAAIYTFTAPANATKIRVKFVVFDVSGTLFLDDVCLKEGQSNRLSPNCEEDCKLISTGQHGSAQTWIGGGGAWVRHNVDNDMQLCHKGDGTITIQGNLTNGASEGGTPCGPLDGWFLDITLSNKKDWTTWNGNYDTYNVDNNTCADNHTSFDYWDVVGTLTGTGCNLGKVYPITGNQAGYQIQVGYGASRGTCDFGMAGWTVYDEDGTDKTFDIYFLLEEACYNPSTDCTLQFDNVVVSNCINQPLMDVATVDATLSWTSAPANGIVEVSIDNKTEYINVTGGVTSPQTVRFTIPADGSTDNNITAKWSNTTDCNRTTTYNAPAACSGGVPEICNDGIDNDMDGLTDCEDPDCGQPNVIDVVLTEPSNCPGLNNGQITINATGDNLEYSIEESESYQSSNVFSNLTAGTYAIRVRNTVTGCVQLHSSGTKPTTDLDNGVCNEICANNIDDDGDGLTDCEDPDCNTIIISKLSYSECVLTGTQYQATMSIEVSWTNPPAGEGINVITPDNIQFIDIVGGATSPFTVQFVIAADNSTNPLTLTYTGDGTSCGVDTYYDAPAPCPIPAERDRPCTNGSGYVGGTVFEDLSGDGLQGIGEPGLEGVLVTATDSIGATVGLALTNNIGVFEFSNLTDGDKFRLEFTAIPSGMYPTNGSTYKGTIVQFVDAPSCTTTLGLLNPITNTCEATNNTILQNGYSVVACLPAGDDVTLAIKDITQLGTLWQTSANRNTNQYSQVPTVRNWETNDFEGEDIFSMTIDPRDGTIYTVASSLYGDGANISSVLFEENIAPKVFKINPETGVVTRIAQLLGSLGLGAIDFDVINEQLLITNMDDGKIYRLNTDGVVLGSYDPLTIDDGISGQLPAVGDRLLGIAFNPIEKRVYYSVWSNHTTFNSTHENINNSNNTIRSVALDVNGDFISSTDKLEIAVPYNPVSATLFLTVPTADIAFNRAGDRLLLSELSIIENNSTGQLSTSAHTGSVKEYQKNAENWTLEPTYASNSQGKYDIGSIVDYQGRNSRGGIAWAYERVSGDTIIGNDDFILATGDALHVASRDGDYIYGYQFIPSTGGNIANSILVDLDNDLVNAEKYVYSDVDIYKNYCANLTLEIGNYVWLDSNEDGVQDLYEVGLAGVNVTLFNAAGDSLTSVVTDADGAYYFNENISGFAGLMPNSTYYIVVGRGGQFNTNNGTLNFVFDLTVPNTGNGNYTDENDSDGIIGKPSFGHPITIAGYPIIELTTGANGQNNYSYDFGFKEVCSTAIAVNDSIPTCPGVEYEGSVSLNDSNHEGKTYSVISNPSNGTITMRTNGTFIYTGNTSTCISDEFVYQVCDASNICCAYATVYLDFADAIKPTLQNIPDNDTISCDEVVPLPPQIFALDNCPRISLDVKEEDTQGEDGCSLYDYTITRTWTAIDQCGNSTSASQVIEVQDLVAPDIYRVYTLPNGKRMVAGVMELVGGNWKTVSLPIDFDTKPIILHQVTTNDGLTPVVAQIQNISVSQFELRIAAEEANTTKRTRESVSWVAMEAGTQSTDYQFEMNTVFLSDTPEIITFQNSFAATPALFTSTQTTNEKDPVSIRHDVLTSSGVALKVQEETSNDTETTHVDERVGYLALEKVGDLRDEKGILLGEVGTTTVGVIWKTITLNNTYANPVVIANSLSTIGSDPAVVQIQNVGLNSFEIKVKEWDYLDGNHANETVSYMVVEGSIPLESPTYCDEGTDSLDIGVDFKAVDNCDVSVIINYTERDTFIGATKMITRTWSAEDECGNSTSYSQQISCQGVSLQLKSILQGAMLNNTGNGLMRDDLRRKDILPLEEPYSKMPFFEHVSSGGGEVMDPNLLSIDGANGIVDWVFIELRDANDRKNVVATKSALIQCDGDVVSVKGDSIIQFTNTRVGDYFVAFRHRNHLGMITLNTESFTPSTIPFVDFTFAFTPVVGSNPSIEVDNLESLWSGDLNSDGKVIYQGPNNDIFHMFLHILQDEKNTDFLPNFISRRYTNDDFNLDGSVIYQGPDNDRAKLLFNTILRHPDNPQKFSNFIIYRGEGN